MSEAPYRLFDYYRYEDREIFFGRDEEVARMVGDILSTRLLALFAPSGSGKSSLLRAGVQPALEKLGFEAVFARVGEDPIASIIAAIEALSPTRSSIALDLKATLSGRDKPVIVFIDQFEELFIQFGVDSDKRKDFPVKLAEVLFDSELQVYFVLSLRSDYFVCLNEFRGAIPTIFHNNANLELRPLDNVAALKAIIGPSDRKDSGFTWEDGLPARIVRDLKSCAINPQVNGVLPITLQIVCHTLWSRLRNGQGAITAKSYETEGGAVEIIERRIFKTFDEYPSRHRRLLCRVFRELVTKDGTKRIQPLSRLREAVGAEQLKSVDALLTRFQDGLLLREETSFGETWVELRHDYLAARISSWLDNEERRLDVLRRRNTMLGVIASAILAGLSAWLWNDYHSYKGMLGIKGHEIKRDDELIVMRQSFIWPLRIMTGFRRPLLQISGVPYDSFEVPNALTDWTQISIRLDKTARDRYELATQLDEFASSGALSYKTNRSTTSVAALQSGDIGYYWAADEKVFRFLIHTLKFGNVDARVSATIALGGLGTNLPAERSNEVTSVLQTTLNDPEPAVRDAAAEVLGSIGASMPAESISQVTTYLQNALNDTDSSVRKHAANTLGRLGWRLPTKRIDEATTALLAAIKDIDPEVRISSARALGFLCPMIPVKRMGEVTNALLATAKDVDSMVRYNTKPALGDLGENLPAESVGEVTSALLASLKDIDSEVKESAAKMLGRLGATLPTERIGEVITALLSAAKDDTPNVRYSVFSAIGSVGENLPTELIREVIDSLLKAIKGADFEVGSSAADALGTLGPRIPDKNRNEITTELLAAAKDEDPGVRASAARALERLGTSLPPERIDEVTTALLASIKDTRLSVSISATRAIGSLGDWLPSERSDEVATALLAAIRVDNPDEKHAAASALGSVVAGLPTQRIYEVTTALLTALNDASSDVGQAAASALGSVGGYLLSERIGEVTTALLVTLKKEDDDLRHSASDALGKLAASLPAERIGEVTSALLFSESAEREARGYAPNGVISFSGQLSPERFDVLTATLLVEIKDGDLRVKRSVAQILGDLGASLPSERIDKVTTALLAAIKDTDSGVANSAIKSLGGLAVRLPSEHIDKVITALLAALTDNLYFGDRPNAAVALGALAPRMDQAQTAAVALWLSIEKSQLTRWVDPAAPEFSALRKITANMNKVSNESLIQYLSDDDSRNRILAVNTLARRTLSPPQIRHIRSLRDDRSGRPWVRMAALDALMEIEREKIAVAADKKGADEG